LWMDKMNGKETTMLDCKAVAKVAKLEKKVARLEKALIAARLELSAARPCLMCGKTTAEGCKADVSPYVCDPAWKPYQS
jgi:hypothetical protein